MKIKTEIMKKQNIVAAGRPISIHNPQTLTCNCGNTFDVYTSKPKTKRCFTCFSFKNRDVINSDYAFDLYRILINFQPGDGQINIPLIWTCCIG